ncbi:hypothetical protein WMY93_013401 [Mugilogobius chulae]|uniref:Transmembrane protein n=1 Tax=Mugilogobius chulae TaxID=88201 RepID=A0AAW0NZD8_9GOBI
MGFPYNDCSNLCNCKCLWEIHCKHNRSQQSNLYRTYVLDKQQRSTNLIVSYVTIVAYPCLVILYNGSMLGRVVCQLWGLWRADYDMECSQNWKKTQNNRMRRLGRTQ